MKKYRGLLTFVLVLAICAGAVKLMLDYTAEYPIVGEAVVYPVNQIDGFNLSIESPAWSPFKGYTLRYNIEIESNDIYYMTTGTETAPAKLEKLIHGTWYSLNPQNEYEAFNSMTFDLGGDTYGFSGSLVQKFEELGTRLETGVYRLTIELTDESNILHYLAAEFTIE